MNKALFSCGISKFLFSRHLGKRWFFSFCFLLHFSVLQLVKSLVLSKCNSQNAFRWTMTDWICIRPKLLALLSFTCQHKSAKSLYKISVRSETSLCAVTIIKRKKKKCFLPIISHSIVCQTTCHVAFRHMINANAVPIKLTKRTAPVSLES